MRAWKLAGAATAVFAWKSQSPSAMPNHSTWCHSRSASRTSAVLETVRKTSRTKRNYGRIHVQG